MGVADCKMGQLRREANSKQISYMTLIGVHSTMHLMHPNYYIQNRLLAPHTRLLLSNSQQIPTLHIM